MRTIQATAFDAAISPSQRSFGGGIVGALRRWLAYRETVRELNGLTRRQLADIGVDGDVEHVARRLIDR